MTRIMKLKIVIAVAAMTLMSANCFAASYTWDGGGTNGLWATDGNWDPDGTKPGAGAAGDDITFQGGTVDGATVAAGVTVGDVSWSSSFLWKMKDGITVDTGGTNDAQWTCSNGGKITHDYTSMILSNNVVLSGSGSLAVEAAGTISGSGGFIVEPGTTLFFSSIHALRLYTFTGGIEIKDGGLVDFEATHLNPHNGQLGDGLITIHEGGRLDAHDTPMDQDFLFVVNTSGSTDDFITGGGASLVFSGQFTFDLSDVTPVVGNSWQITSGATCSYDPAFSVSNATETANVWTGISDGLEYPVAFTFDESTGELILTEVLKPKGTVIITK